MLSARTYLVEEACGGLDRAYRLHQQDRRLVNRTYCHAFFVRERRLRGKRHPHLVAAYIKYHLHCGRTRIAGHDRDRHQRLFISKIPYKYFTLIQKFFAIPFAFGIYHLLFVTSDISRYQPLRIFMLVVVALGAVAWIYRELFYRFLAPQAVYIVKEVRDKGAGVLEISLTPKKDRLKFKPGQFAYFFVSFKKPFRRSASFFVHFRA